MHAWCVVLDCEAGDLKSALLGSLTTAGISLTTDVRRDLSGIVIFGQAAPETLEFIRETSNGGTSRILAVTDRPIADEDVWKLLHSGSSDVICWEGAHTGHHIAARLERWAAVEQLVSSPLVTENLVGQSSAWLRLLRQAAETAAFSDASVLIMGETGTGKELLARLIHTLDQRSGKGDLVLLDSTTVVAELSGSEFFGHERGAYTGALGSREGAFALAAGGTLFLDEVGELEPRLQAQLLRVIQEKTYKRVGGNTWHRADFRLVCATSRNLKAELKSGHFRADLYYRIASCVCQTVPLSQRREDIPLLAKHFVKQVCQHELSPELDPSVERHLIAREYPGNVRDLRQLVTRMITRHAGTGPLTLADIPEDERPSGDAANTNWGGLEFEASIRKACMLGAGMKEIGRAAEATAVRIIIAEEDGKLSRAAARLGVTERALQLRRSAQRAASNRISRTEAA